MRSRSPCLAAEWRFLGPPRNFLGLSRKQYYSWPFLGFLFKLFRFHITHQHCQRGVFTVLLGKAVTYRWPLPLPTQESTLRKVIKLPILQRFLTSLPPVKSKPPPTQNVLAPEAADLSGNASQTWEESFQGCKDLNSLPSFLNWIWRNGKRKNVPCLHHKRTILYL